MHLLAHELAGLRARPTCLVACRAARDGGWLSRAVAPSVGRLRDALQASPASSGSLCERSPSDTMPTSLSLSSTTGRRRTCMSSMRAAASASESVSRTHSMSVVITSRTLAFGPSPRATPRIVMSRSVSMPIEPPAVADRQRAEVVALHQLRRAHEVVVGRCDDHLRGHDVPYVHGNASICKCASMRSARQHGDAAAAPRNDQRKCVLRVGRCRNGGAHASLGCDAAMSRARSISLPIERPAQEHERERDDRSDERFDQKIVEVAAGQQHRLPERRLGHVAQHEREHERRERILELLEHVADDAEHHHHHDVEHVVVDRVRADRADHDDHGRDDRERDAQDRRPPGHRRQHDDEADDVAEVHRGDEAPHELLLLDEQQRTRAAGPR